MASLRDVEQKCLSFGLTQVQADEIVDLTRGCMIAHARTVALELNARRMGEALTQAVREAEAEKKES